MAASVVPKVLLILGAGPRIGLNTARLFKHQGYKVAVASRTPSPDLASAADLAIKADFTDVKSVEHAFEEVAKKLGAGPRVVVYNASVGAFSPKNDPFQQDVEIMMSSMNVNFNSAYVAAQNAVKYFRTLPAGDDVKKTFMYTGNATNLLVIPGMMSAGAGKSAAAHMMASAAVAYKEEKLRFYFVDEREPSGAPVYGRINGEANATAFLELAEKEDQGPSDWTFVKGKGYVDFQGKTG